MTDSKLPDPDEKVVYPIAHNRNRDIYHIMDDDSEQPQPKCRYDIENLRVKERQKLDGYRLCDACNPYIRTSGDTTGPTLASKLHRMDKDDIEIQPND